MIRTVPGGQTMPVTAVLVAAVAGLAVFGLVLVGAAVAIPWAVSKVTS